MTLPRICPCEPRQVSLVNQWRTVFSDVPNPSAHSTEGVFLLVTNKRDLTSDLIVLELERRGLKPVRLNTEDLGAGLLEITPVNGGWKLEFSNWSCTQSDVRAAYFRRPEPIKLLDTVREDCVAYSAMEWQSALEGLYFTLESKWLNAPYDISRAENKVRQLALATSIGLQVPQTLITNSPHAAREFCALRHAIGKPLRQALLQIEGAESVLFTTRVHIDEKTDSESVRAAPLILQEEVPKRFDVRVTVVGEKTFAATIDSQASAETQVDWRRSSKVDLQHLIHSLPASLEAKCIALTKSMGLRFGAIDFVLDRAGDYWFLEINPNGQWGWIEVRTGLPIASAIVDELVKIASEEIA